MKTEFEAYLGMWGYLGTHLSIHPVEDYPAGILNMPKDIFDHILECKFSSCKLSLLSITVYFNSY